MLAVTVGLLGGCVNPQRRLTADLRRAATAPNMPKVVACWEQTFEANGFTGEHLVLVDFTVTESGRLEDVHLEDAVDLTAGEPSPLGDGGAFGECVTRALQATTLPLRWGDAVRVSGFRIAFSDPNRQARESAAEGAATLLIGPRADRCQGLFSHAPPRDAGLLHKELVAAQAAAEAASDDRDKLARAYQRGYDLSLELAARLERDAATGASKASRRRMLDELERVRGLSGSLGEKIGCEPP